MRSELKEELSGTEAYEVNRTRHWRFFFVGARIGCNVVSVRRVDKNDVKPITTNIHTLQIKEIILNKHIYHLDIELDRLIGYEFVDSIVGNVCLID